MLEVVLVVGLRLLFEPGNRLRLGLGRKLLDGLLSETKVTGLLVAGEFCGITGSDEKTLNVESWDGFVGGSVFGVVTITGPLTPNPPFLPSSFASFSIVAVKKLWTRS